MLVQYASGEYHEHCELEACHDCFLYVANGDEPEPLDMTYWDEADNWKASAVNEEWEGWNLMAKHIEEDEESSSFSWTGCEVCNRRLGGDRGESGRSPWAFGGRCNRGRTDGGTDG